MTFIKLISDNKALCFKHAREFERTFGVKLRPYFDFITGFDVVEFDDKIIKSGDRAIVDVVRERYGDEAVTLIAKLL